MPSTTHVLDGGFPSHRYGGEKTERTAQRFGPATSLGLSLATVCQRLGMGDSGGIT